MTRNNRADTSQAHITENLKRAFQDTSDEDVPDKFRVMLNMFRDQSGPVALKRGTHST
ncbi:NepR family anti-sigma factor [Tateyamaria omphalii]|nr:NepR family anti-sigma factor [Tateyamaria omphalii]